MPVIARLNNAKIQMFADDHAPPHFHLFGPSSNALVAIGTLTVIRGRADVRDLAEAVAWARANRRILIREWSRLNERG